MDWKTPKSVRQIGDVKGRCKIYVEDYVITFAKRLVKEAEGSEAAGVLLGHRMFRSHEKLFQISGMVVIHDFAERKGDSFSSEMWTDIYTDMKENFSGVDVVGWFYTGRKSGKRKGTGRTAGAAPEKFFRWGQASDLHSAAGMAGDVLSI